MNPESPQQLSTEEVLTRRSPLKKYGLPAGLLAGGVAMGMAFAPVGLAGAQDDTEPESPDTEAPADEAPTVEGPHGHRRGHRGFGARAGFDAISELTGLTAEDLRAGFENDLTLAEQAAAAGVGQDELVNAIVAEMQAHLAEAVVEGKVTQERADEISADMVEHVTTAVTTAPSERPDRGPGHGRGHGKGFEVLEELGLSQEEIRAGFDAGNTLAETAAEQGISQDELVDALVAQAMERANEAVVSGRVTQDQVDERLADLEERITERVTADPDDRPQGFEGRRGHRGQRGFGGGFSPDGETQTSGFSV